MSSKVTELAMDLCMVNCQNGNIHMSRLNFNCHDSLHATLGIFIVLEILYNVLWWSKILLEFDAHLSSNFGNPWDLTLKSISLNLHKSNGFPSEYYIRNWLASKMNQLNSPSLGTKFLYTVSWPDLYYMASVFKASLHKWIRLQFYVPYTSCRCQFVFTSRDATKATQVPFVTSHWL